MTMWKSATSRHKANIEPLSGELFVPLNFRSTGIRFFHTLLPIYVVTYLRSSYLRDTGMIWVYQVRLLSDYDELSTFLYPGGFLGHITNTISFILSYPQLKLVPTAIRF